MPGVGTTMPLVLLCSGQGPTMSVAPSSSTKDDTLKLDERAQSGGPRALCSLVAGLRRRMMAPPSFPHMRHGLAYSGASPVAPNMCRPHGTRAPHRGNVSGSTSKATDAPLHDYTTRPMSPSKTPPPPDPALTQTTTPHSRRCRQAALPRATTSAPGCRF
jgi:hypothetical protein